MLYEALTGSVALFVITILQETPGSWSDAGVILFGTLEFPQEEAISSHHASSRSPIPLSHFLLSLASGKLLLLTPHSHLTFIDIKDGFIVVEVIFVIISFLLHTWRLVSAQWR